MTKEELISLVNEILDVENKTEKEIDELLNILKENIPDPDVTDLLYWNDLSPKEIIEKALNYKPIQL